MYRNLIVLGILCYLCVDGLRFSDLYKDDEENSQLEKVVTKRLEEGDKSFPVRLRRVKNRRFSDGMGKYAVRNLSGGDKHANSVKPNLALTPATPLHLSLSSLSKDVTPGAIYREIKYDGEGCHWFGVAPFCNENCPLDYDHIRSHNGHCSLTELLEGRLNCIPDRSFGKPCWNVGGEKHLCCKGQTIYCSWNGRWSSSKKAYNTNCQFYRSNNHCGRLHCSINNENIKDYNAGEISGKNCDEIQLFGMKGQMTCGFLAWKNRQGLIIDAWYKQG